MRGRRRRTKLKVGHRLRTAPQRRRARGLVVLLVLLAVGLVGHTVTVYGLSSRTPRPAAAMRVAAVVIRAPQDDGGAAWSPLGTLRLALADGTPTVVTTYVDPGVRDGDVVHLWITPDGRETSAPSAAEAPSPWGHTLDTCVWALLVAASLLGLAAWGTVPLVHAQERRLFTEIVAPLQDDAARWLHQ